MGLMPLGGAAAPPGSQLTRCHAAVDALLLLLGWAVPTVWVAQAHCCMQQRGQRRRARPLARAEESAEAAGGPLDCLLLGGRPIHERALAWLLVAALCWTAATAAALLAAAWQDA